MKHVRLFEEFLNENFSSDAKLNSFLEALSSRGQLSRNPINPREWIYDNVASLEFHRFDKGDRDEITFADIMVLEKGQGHGKKILKDITDSADELGYTLTLDAKPFGNDPSALKLAPLVKFYTQSGFEVDLEAYDGDFSTAEEMIEYAEEYDEAVPMLRKPQPVTESETLNEMEELKPYLKGQLEAISKGMTEAEMVKAIELCGFERKTSGLERTAEYVFTDPSRKEDKFEYRVYDTGYVRQISYGTTRYSGGKDIPRKGPTTKSLLPTTLLRLALVLRIAMKRADIYSDWKKSKLSAKEYLLKKRGSLTGKKWGF